MTERPEELECVVEKLQQRSTVTVPGQKGANITRCATMSNDNAIYQIPTVTPYNAEHLVIFLHPVLNPVWEFFPACRWKVYDNQPYDQMSF